MGSNLLLGLWMAALVNILSAIETSRDVEGFPNGYLSDCPGSTKPAKISRRTLRNLSFIHLYPGNFITANRTEYNYFNMKKLAKELDFTKTTTIYMNGYLDSSHVFPVTPAIGSIYTRIGHNVLLLEYVHFSAFMYPLAARLLRAVGERTAEMLAELTKYGLDPKKLEIIGISLGGQGISFIGKNYQRITGQKISRITALDPAGPCFRRLGPELRIDASDADRVDVIHTNNDGYGFAGAVGHVNFYVNGGEFQVADLAELPCTDLCSHVRSFQLWIAAMLNPDKFVAVQCDTIQDARDRNCFNRPMVTNLLGPKTNFSKPGIFHLQSLHYFPYYLGEKGAHKGVDKFADFLKNMNKDDVMVVYIVFYLYMALSLIFLCIS